MNKEVKKFPLVDILSASFAAYRINGDYYKETRRFSEDNPTQFSNKDCLLLQFDTDTEMLPKDWQQMTIKDEDLQNAVASVEWINKENTLAIMADTLSDYMKSLITCLNTKELTKDMFGIVAVTPKIYFEGKKKKDVKKSLKTNFSESKHISTIGSVFQGEFTLHEIKFVDKFSCHVLNGSCEGNLISFFKSFDQTKDLPKENTTFKIKAKVKRHGENFITKFPETILNYVKIG
tara:strand:+ start:7475 stop:8176 length:702 start_codon:yes stop_codon:yes gene_type:complete